MAVLEVGGIRSLLMALVEGEGALCHLSPTCSAYNNTPTQFYYLRVSFLCFSISVVSVAFRTLPLGLLNLHYWNIGENPRFPGLHSLSFSESFPAHPVIVTCLHMAHQLTLFLQMTEAKVDAKS